MMERNYEWWSCTWTCALDHLLDLSFLCDFNFFFHLDCHVIDSTVLSWLVPAVWVMHLSMPWESSWAAETAGHDFPEWWLFFLHPAFLDPRLLFLGEQPPCTLSCKAVGGVANPCNDGGTWGSNPLHSLRCLFICWQNEVTALRQVPHVKFAL